MTDSAIIAASYAAERNYSHNPDDVIGASDAVGAWGTAKESTTELVDWSGNGNVADIHGAMPTEGFIQGRRFDGDDDYLDCGDVINSNPIDGIALETLIITSDVNNAAIIAKWEIDGLTQIKTFNLLLIGNSVRLYVSENGSDEIYRGKSNSNMNDNTLHHIIAIYNNNNPSISLCVDGIVQSLDESVGVIPNSLYSSTTNVRIGQDEYTSPPILNLSGDIKYTSIYNTMSMEKAKQRFNTLARLPFWSVNYTDYPDNVTEYTDNLPYSSSIINSGTFKVDDDKLQCVAAGTITYSASYDFNGSEFVKVTIDGVEYAGTGTITQGNTTVSVAQGSNKITITMGTGDSIEGEIGIQFREEV